MANVYYSPYMKAENGGKGIIHIPKEAVKINTPKACQQLG